MHFMSHRGSSRLARVIPSMHVHLCVVWWLFSSPVSFSSPFRCSSSRPSRCPPPSSTTSSSPKTCATSAWGPWPVLTTRHPSQFWWLPLQHGAGCTVRVGVNGTMRVQSVFHSVAEKAMFFGSVLRSVCCQRHRHCRSSDHFFCLLEPAVSNEGSTTRLMF